MINLNTAANDSSAPLNVQPARLVDDIGSLKARLAPLLADLKTLEAALKVHGPGRYKGAFYEANVFVQERDTLDMAAVRAKLSRQFIAANTKTSEVTVLKVTARQLGEQAVTP
jgi:hypothetical protein